MILKRYVTGGIALVFTLVTWAASALAAAPADLERQVRELVRQNRLLTERLNQVEQELSSMKGHKAAMGEKAAGEEKWYDRIDVGLSVAGLVMGVEGLDKDIADATLADENKGYSSVQVDLELATEFDEKSRALILFEMGSGKHPATDLEGYYPFAGIADEAVMTGDGLNEGDVRISEAWYERDFDAGAGNLRFRIGKVDITTDFDTNEVANDENSQFMSEMFVNNIAVDWPEYAFGAMLWYETEKLSVGLGYADYNAAWDNIFDYPFGIFEVDLRPGNGGNYRFYAWYNGDSEEASVVEGLGPSELYGLGMSLDQKIVENVNLFVRFGWVNGNDHDAPIEYSVSGGVCLGGAMWNRPEDVFAIGIGTAALSDAYEDLLKENNEDDANECHMEAYYSFQVDKHLAITPSIQWTQNTAGLDDADDFWVLSLRGLWEF